jgi:hypothetical protein
VLQGPERFAPASAGLLLPSSAHPSDPLSHQGKFWLHPLVLGVPGSSSADVRQLPYCRAFINLHCWGPKSPTSVGLNCRGIVLRSTDTPCAGWRHLGGGGGLAHWFVLPTPPPLRAFVAKQQMTSVPGGFRLPRGPLPNREPRENPARRWVPAAGTGRGKPISCAYTWTEPEPEQQSQLRSPLAAPPPAPQSRWPARPGRADSQAPRLRALRSAGSGSAGSEDAGWGQRARGEGGRRAGGLAPRGVGGVHVSVCACVWVSERAI